MTYERFNPNWEPTPFNPEYAEWQGVLKRGPSFEEEALITCYQDVFAGYPWFETWSTKDVRATLRRIPEGASCWIYVDNDLRCGPYVMGFTWGFEISDSDLTKMTDPKTVAAFRSKFGGGRIAYQSELGVLESHRKRGVARELVSRRNQDFLQLGLEIGVIRTKADPPSVTYQWYQRIGYEVFYRYDDGTHRVLMARKLAGLEF